MTNIIKGDDVQYHPLNLLKVFLCLLTIFHIFFSKWPSSGPHTFFYSWAVLD